MGLSLGEGTEKQNVRAMVEEESNLRSMCRMEISIHRASGEVKRGDSSTAFLLMRLKVGVVAEWRK